MAGLHAPRQGQRRSSAHAPSKPVASVLLKKKNRTFRLFAFFDCFLMALLCKLSNLLCTSSLPLAAQRAILCGEKHRGKMLGCCGFKTHTNAPKNRVPRQLQHASTVGSWIRGTPIGGKRAAMGCGPGGGDGFVGGMSPTSEDHLPAAHGRACLQPSVSNPACKLWTRSCLVSGGQGFTPGAGAVQTSKS